MKKKCFLSLLLLLLTGNSAFSETGANQFNSSKLQKELNKQDGTPATDISTPEIDDKYVDTTPKIYQLISQLDREFGNMEQELSTEEISASEELYRLVKSSSEKAIIIKEINRKRLHRNFDRIADNFYRNKQFDQALFFYRILRSSNMWLYSGIHSFDSARREGIESSIHFIEDNRDYKGIPLSLFVEATQADRQNVLKLLQQIKEDYPNSKIIDDIDFYIDANNLLKNDLQHQAQFWEQFIDKYPESHLLGKAQERLALQYEDLGREFLKKEQFEQAEEYYKKFLMQPLVTEYKYFFTYIDVGNFFENRNDLEYAEKAYRKASLSGFPTACVTFVSFYQKHYNLLEIFDKEKDPVIQKRMIFGIYELGSKVDSRQAVDVLISAFQNKDASVRREAAFFLSNPDCGLLNYAEKNLDKKPRKKLIEVLIGLIEYYNPGDEEKTVGGHVVTILKHLTGQDFGSDKKQWQKWWNVHILSSQ